MNRRLLVLALISFIFTTAEAKRAMYTCEVVDSAKLIGVWTSKEIRNGKLAAPKELLKGDASIAAEISGSELKNILQKLQNGENLILMVNKWNGKTHVGYYGILKADKENLKTVKTLISQKEEVSKWSTYSPAEEIANSHIIMKGKIIDAGKVCPTIHRVLSIKVMKGSIRDRQRIYPVNHKYLDKECLLLIQQMPGSGPEYRLMKAVPYKNAEQYLKLLK